MNTWNCSVQDFSAAKRGELCISFYFSAVQLFVVVLLLYFLLGRRSPNILAILLSSRSGGSYFICTVGVCCFWGRALCGGVCTWQVPVIFLLKVLQAAGKKSNISWSKTLCVFALQLCCCSWASEGLELGWGEMWQRKWEKSQLFLEFTWGVWEHLGCFPAVLSCLFQGQEGLDFCSSKTQLGWRKGQEFFCLCRGRLFPAQLPRDTIPRQSPVQGGDGWRHCLSLLWRAGLSLKWEAVINPQGFIAVFKDGSVSALNTANKIVLVLLCEECAGVGETWEFCLFWSLSLAPAWTLLSVCSFQLVFTLKMEIIQ